MTECEQYQELISRMLDDDLSKAERSALAAHVKTCPDCAAVYVAFRSLSEQLGADLEEVPTAVHENIMAEVRRDSIRARNSAHRSHRAWHTALTIAACLVLVVAASLSLPKLAPRMGSSAPAPQAAPAAVEEYVRAEESMAAPAPMPEEKAAPEGNLTLGGALQNAAQGADEAPAEEAAEGEAPRSPLYSDEGELILDAEQSAALLDALSGEAVYLEQQPEQEIHVLLQKDESSRPLTILLGAEGAYYVRADGDSTCRIDLSPEELLSLLGLTE